MRFIGLRATVNDVIVISGLCRWNNANHELTHWPSAGTIN